MKKYYVASGDGKGYYGVGYESYLEATELLKISQRHDPRAYILYLHKCVADVEEEQHFTNADRIRAMSDKELEWTIDPAIVPPGMTKREWLQQPAKEG